MTLRTQLTTWARRHPRAIMALAMLAAFALALTITVATRTTPPTFRVWERDTYGIYDQPAKTGATQHCWNTGRTASNDTTVNLWDCDNIKSQASSLGVVQCVQATGGATEPYIYCSTTGSASGANGASHVLNRRP